MVSSMMPQPTHSRTDSVSWRMMTPPTALNTASMLMSRAATEAGGEPLGVDLDGVGNAYPQHAGKQQRHHGRRQVGQRQALGEEGHQSRQGTGAEELHHHEGQGVHVGRKPTPHQDMQGEAQGAGHDGGIVHVQ